MAKKVDINVAIANAFISLKKQTLTTEEINEFINLVDSLLPNSYYIYSNGNYISGFCNDYGFLVENFDNNILLKQNNYERLCRYFRIGLPIELVSVLDEAGAVFYQRYTEEQSEKIESVKTKKVIS